MVYNNETKKTFASFALSLRPLRLNKILKPQRTRSFTQSTQRKISASFARSLRSLRSLRLNRILKPQRTQSFTQSAQRKTSASFACSLRSLRLKNKTAEFAKLYAECAKKNLCDLSVSFAPFAVK